LRQIQFLNHIEDLKHLREEAGVASSRIERFPEKIWSVFRGQIGRVVLGRNLEPFEALATLIDETTRPGKSAGRDRHRRFFIFLRHTRGVAFVRSSPATKHAQCRGPLLKSIEPHRISPLPAVPEGMPRSTPSVLDHSRQAASSPRCAAYAPVAPAPRAAKPPRRRAA